MRQQNSNNNNSNSKNRMRGRGRNHNNKPSNSINRNYESNGPDVKIRGNAAHIAEKYSTLARDALSSGDRVVAENYLQHAEHYNRIVFAANALRDEQQAAQAAARGNQPDENRSEQPEAQANGSDGANNDSESGNEIRRPRRRDSRGESRNNGRAPRKEENTTESKAEENDNGAAANDDASAAPVAVDIVEKPKPRTRRTSRKKEDAPESITDDAAGLPQGLLGASADD